MRINEAHYYQIFYKTHWLRFACHFKTIKPATAIRLARKLLTELKRICPCP